MADKLEQLERLGKLHDEGRINNAEFETLKAEILDPQASSGAEGPPTPPAISPVAPTTAEPTQAVREVVRPVVTGAVPNSPWIQPATKRGVGWALIALGVLSVVAVAWNEVAQSSSTSDILLTVLFGFVINPLVWLGVFGAFWVVRNPRSVSGASPTAQNAPTKLTRQVPGPPRLRPRRWEVSLLPAYLADHASSPNPYIRRRVAEHPYTPEGVIRALAKDKKWTVRAGVTYNENVPTDVLEELRNDSYNAVRTRAVKALSSRP